MPRRTRHGAGESKASDANATAECDAEAKIAALIEELEVEVEARCKALQSDGERMAACIRSTYRMQLEKLPKKIRSMTVKEFFQNNGSNSDLHVPELVALAVKYSNPACAVQEEIVRTPLKVVTNPNGTATILRSTRAKSRIENGPSDNQTKRKAVNAEEPAAAEEGRTTRRAAARQQSIVASTPAVSNSKSISVVANTPAFSKDLPFTPAHNHGGTVLRLPKRGESIFSTRGSPVAVVTSDATAQEVNVANPTEVAKLSHEGRLKALQEVLAIQQQLESLITNLRV